MPILEPEVESEKVLETDLRYGDTLAIANPHSISPADLGITDIEFKFSCSALENKPKKWFEDEDQQSTLAKMLRARNKKGLR